MKSIIFLGVDPQVDFIDGALTNKEAQGNVGLLNKAAHDARRIGASVRWTNDVHDESTYFDTLEGQKLPIGHCFHGTPGAMFHEEIEVVPGDIVYNKFTFGSYAWLEDVMLDKNDLTIIAGGYCTDICGISNVLAARMADPNARIYWLAFASAATTPEKQEAALAVMESCQIDVIRTYAEYTALLATLRE